MLTALVSFAALSMAGTVLLSVLPEGGTRRTASLVISLVTLLCWAEGVAALIGLPFPYFAAENALVPTDFSVEHAADETAAMLAERWDPSP